MYPESLPRHNYDPGRVERYMLKAKSLVEDPDNGELNKLNMLEARKKLWDYCKEQGIDPRDYAMYHIMFGTPESLAERELDGGIRHEDLPGGESIAGFIDSFEEEG